MALTVVMVVMNSVLGVTRYADLLNSHPFSDHKILCSFLWLCQHKDSREKRSAEYVPIPKFLNALLVTTLMCIHYTELEETDAEAENDARKMKINELLKIIGESALRGQN